MCLLWSLECQTFRDFKIRIIHDGHHEETKASVESFASKTSIQISYDESKIRFNDYGHSLRQWGLQESESEFLLLTNDDNYYTPNFLEEMLETLLSKKSDIVYCDMVHSHVMNDLPNPIGYQTLVTEEKFCRIDIGCFIFRTSLGQRVGFKARDFNADWTFFSDMISTKPKVVKLPKVMFVHN
jgi:hypothetical protein